VSKFIHRGSIRLVTVGGAAVGLFVVDHACEDGWADGGLHPAESVTTAPNIAMAAAGRRRRALFMTAS
jgi:hypothetical protein